MNGDDVNDDIIIGSIIGIVTVFVVGMIIGFWWFCKREDRNKGHIKIDNEDIDEEIEIGVTGESEDHGEI